MWDYGTAHAMSEIITQADVRIKKLVQQQQQQQIYSAKYNSG